MKPTKRHNGPTKVLPNGPAVEATTTMLSSIRTRSGRPTCHTMAEVSSVTPMRTSSTITVNADETITARVGQPFVVRTWVHSGKELWRLVPQDGVVALESALFEQFPQPGEGVGFTDGYDITVRINRPGTYRLTFEHLDKASGQIDRSKSNQTLSVTAR